MIVANASLEFLLLSLLALVMMLAVGGFITERVRKKFISIDGTIHAFLCRLNFLLCFSWTFAFFLNIFFSFYDLKIDIYQFFPATKIWIIWALLNTYLAIINRITFGQDDPQNIIFEFKDWIMGFFVKDK